MRSIKSCLVAAFLLLGCSSGEFAGDAGAAGGRIIKQKCDPQKDPTCNPNVTQTPDPTKNNSNNPNNDPTQPPAVTTDDGSINIADCAKGTLVEDPNQEFSFGANEERTLLNSLGKYVQIPQQFHGQGAVLAEQATADVVCKLKGYKAAISFGTGKWHSCRDNVNAKWNDVNKNFDLLNGCSPNKKLQNTVCKGRLHDKCDKDKTWIFLKP